MPHLITKTKNAPVIRNKRIKPWYTEANLVRISAHILNHISRTILRPCSTHVFEEGAAEGFCRWRAAPAATSCGWRQQREDVNVPRYRRPRMHKCTVRADVIIVIIAIGNIVS